MKDLPATIVGWIAALCVGLGVVTATPARPAQITYSKFQTVWLDGSIAVGDLDRLKQAIKGVHAHTIILNSDGGNVVEAAEIAAFIHKHPTIETAVAAKRCASACLLIYAAAKERGAFGFSQLGVHSASLKGKETSASLAVTTAMAREMATYRVPPRIIGLMVSTPGTDMVWLTEADAKDWGIHIMTLDEPKANGRAGVK